MHALTLSIPHRRFHTLANSHIVDSINICTMDQSKGQSKQLQVPSSEVKRERTEDHLPPAKRARAGGARAAICTRCS